MSKECNASPEERLQILINKITDKRIKSVVENLTSIPEYKTKRAGDIHHKGVGGLLEHSLEVAENSLTLATYFEGIHGENLLSKDFLIFGGLLHDIGKVQMEDGECRLPGYYSHVAIGANIVYKELVKENFKSNEVEQLTNIILAHHSRIKKEPNAAMYHSLESYIVHTCDAASAVITAGLKSINDGAEVFTVYSQNEMRPAFGREK